MFRRIAWLFVFGLIAPIAPSKADDAEDEVARLKGNWTMASVEVNGEKLPEEGVKMGRLVIEGKKYTVSLGGMMVASSFTVDPGKSPRTIDFTYLDGEQKGQTLKGIYKLEGDTLTMCRALAADGDRPTKFATSADSGQILVVYNRAKE